MQQAGAPNPHRAEELEDWLNRRIFHPLSRFMARGLVPTGVTPNMVSVLGVLVVVGAALVYTRMAWPLGAILGFLLHLFWHVVDGADGDLARLTGKTSPIGEFVDGVCDYLGHIVLYIAFASVLDDSWGGWAWCLIVLAGGAHIAQNNHYESLRRTYLWWAYGVPWLRQSEAGNDLRLRELTWFNLVFGWMARDYLTLSSATAPKPGEIDRLLKSASGNPEQQQALRQIVRDHSGGIMAWSRLLGSNFRTVLLGVCMLIDSGWAFFVLEVVALNLLLVLSIRRSRGAEQAAVLAMQAHLAGGEGRQ